MDNLQLINIKRTPLNLKDKFTKHIVCVKNKVYLLLHNYLSEYEEGHGKLLGRTNGNIGGEVIQFEYLPRENYIWIGFNKIFQYVNLNEHPIVIETIECQSKDLTIEVAEWNPLKEAFVAITITGDIYVFEVDFHGKFAKQLSFGRINDDFYKPPVTLGWGSAEQQFRSPQEIAAMEALKGEEPKVDMNCDMKISWHNEGKKFAISYYIDGMRKIRIFNSRCLLEFQSEENPGLQSVIACRPTGNDIAAAIITTKRCQIAILEKNALLKTTYNLAKTAYIEKICWSPCGEVLAVYQSANKDSPASIDLYWLTNDVMHLKQRLEILEINPLVNLEFLSSPTTLINLRVTTVDEIIDYTFHYVYDYSQTVTKTHNTCATINGSSVYLTYCERGMKPPPYYDAVAQLDHPVNFIIFNPTKPLVAFIDSIEKITVFQVTGTKLTKLNDYQLRGKPGFLAPLKFYQFVWLKDKIFCVGEKSSPLINEVDAYYLVLGYKASDKRSFSISTRFDKGINYLGYIEFQEKVAEKTALGVTEEMVPPTTLSATHLQMRTILIGDNIYVFSLTFNYNFFINDIEIFQGVNSFILHDGYISLTLLDGQLFTIRTTHQGIAEVLANKFANIYSRQVEVGATLICATPDSSSVALQIPRGNIELCSCRIVSIDRIEKCLNEDKWKEAIYILRVQRLNLNILVDLDYNRFYFNINLFIEAMEMPENLSEFLLILEDKNIFNDAYRDCLITGLPDKMDKRKMICSEIVRQLIVINHNHYIHPIITACFVIDSPSSMNDAFTHIQGLLKQVDDDDSSLHAAVEAFKSARSLKPLAEIFEAALLNYDPNLIMFVGRHLEMDPTEYEPLVKDLRQLPPCRIPFKINDYLEKYAEALAYLLRCQPYDTQEIYEYVDAHDMYEETIWCVKQNSPIFFKLCYGLATNLVAAKNYEEAAVYYQRGKYFYEALEAYTTALCWKEAIEIMEVLEMEQAEVFSHLSQIAEGLKSKRKPEEAALLYEEYLKDYETAIRIFIDSNLFSKAIALAQKYKRPDIFKTEIVPAIKEHTESLCNTFDSINVKFVAKKTRLMTIRAEKKKKFEAEEAEFHFQIDDDDIGVGAEVDVRSIVTTGTMRSRASTSSGMSARSRRKQQRKLHSTKVGSLYEDIALMESLHKLISSAFTYGPIVRDICMLVLRFQVKGRPSQDVVIMYHQLLQLQLEMKESVEKIWPLDINYIDAQPLALALYKNINMLDAEFRFPPKNMIISWKITGFPPLELEAIS